MANSYDYDLVVIGSGPGGYVAAIRASQLNLKTAVIEKDKLGGVCLNIGCIPSKNIIHQADVFESIADLKKIGVSIDSSTLDYSKVYQNSRTAADRLSKGVAFLLKKNNVDVITGKGRITGKHQISVDDDRKISAKNILIATGSTPRQIPGFEFDEEVVLSSTGILMLRQLPKRLLVMGSGAIGAEFSYVMNAFGVKVDLVEMLDRILPLEDADCSAVVAKSFEKKGITLHTSTKAVKMERIDSGVSVTLDKNGTQQTIETDKILVAVGRAPFTDGLGLESVGIKTEKGFIPVGDYCQTSVPGIFAIGDVVNSPLLAHVASKEGEMAVEYMAGHASAIKRLDPTTIPSAVYCEPQVASFGLKEEDAKERNINYKAVTFPYRGAGKAVAVGKADGIVKIIFNTDTREILGAHIAGASATEMIHEVLLARTAELLPEDIATMIHAHPTLSETVMEALRMAEGWAIHI